MCVFLWLLDNKTTWCEKWYNYSIITPRHFDNIRSVCFLHPLPGKKCLYMTELSETTIFFVVSQIDVELFPERPTKYELCFVLRGYRYSQYIGNSTRVREAPPVFPWTNFDANHFQCKCLYHTILNIELWAKCVLITVYIILICI